jgi:hypothetical protein
MALLIIGAVGVVRAQTGPVDSRLSGQPSAPAKAGVDSDYPNILQPGEDPENRLLSPFLKHLAGDQKQFWTAPAHFQVKDLKWIVPFAGATAAFIASDSWMSKQVPLSHVSTSKTVSEYGTYAFLGLSGSSFLFGQMTHDDHLQEAGLLTGEAAINATGVAYLFKELTQRQRPYQGNEHGNFFEGGTSFPSEHSAIAWSVASLWAHEYPGWLSQAAAYALASTVTVTRVTSRQHFASDAVVGSALGWYFGRQVYRSHHDPELGGSGWGSLFEEKTGDHPRNPENMASPYVPLDSWVYPALERLMALGYIQNAFLDVRPWTRMGCAQMVEEAGEKLSNTDAPGEAAALYRELSSEFLAETERLDGAANLGASVDSVYTRVMNISGPPLRDGYHFAQTIVDDFGRPFGDGANVVSGGYASAVAGPFAFYARGEYQYAPSVSAIPASAIPVIAAGDFTSCCGPNFVPPGFASTLNTGSYNRFQLLEGTASFAYSNVQISVGKQSVWQGPGESGPLQFSDNAAPVPMVKIENVAPYDIPLLSKLFGPAHNEFFLGQLSGLHWVFQSPTLYGPNNVNPQPFIHGDKISFKPTANLEFGMGLVAMFGGPGLPFTFKEFIESYYSHKSNEALNPGKRFSAADFTYRVPKLRNWLTAYLDSMVVDEISPIGSTRPSLNPGLYMPQVPKLPKLQLRAEGLKTNQKPGECCVPGNTYFDIRYISGFTNNGVLMGNWIGRGGWGGQAWATYSLSPRSSVQLGYRRQIVDSDFLRGGNLTDFSAKADYTFRRQLEMTTVLQYEHWDFPLLAPTAQSNFTASFQVTYWPKWKLH